jgi:xylose isomerase
MTTYFPDIKKIEFEGKSSRNPLAFRYYDENQIVAGKTMKDHLRFAVCYWHTFCGTGADPFGLGPQKLPWLNASNPMEQAYQKKDAAFEFFTKLGVAASKGEPQQISGKQELYENILNLYIG